MYRRADDIQELRQKGLPWLAAVLLLVLILLAGCFLYLFVDFNTLQTKLASDEKKNNTDASLTLSTTLPTIVEERVEEARGDTPVEDSFESLLDRVESDESAQRTTTSTPKPTSPLFWPERHTNHIKYHKAVVQCSIELCAEIGRNILLRGGNAADAAVSTSMCMGGLHPQSSGLGANLIATIHNRRKGESWVVNALSMAPQTARPVTFAMNANLSKQGYSSIGVPGFLAGAWTIYKRFGSGQVAWQDLLIPTVELLEKGFPANDQLISAIQSRKSEVMQQKSISSLFNASLSVSDRVTDFVLARTLRRLATSHDPQDLFYRRSMADVIVQEMKSKGGLMTKGDLVHYEVLVEKAVVAELKEAKLIGPTAPTTFPLLVHILQETQELYAQSGTGGIGKDFQVDLLNLQYRLIKNIYKIADPLFETLTNIFNDTTEDAKSLITSVNDIETTLAMERSETTDEQNSHLNVIDSDGMIVSLSSTLNSKFGALRRSEKLGFVWNNAMASFSTEEDEENVVEGKKRPRTQTMPIVMLQEDVSIGIGVTGTAHSLAHSIQFLTNYLFTSANITTALEQPFLFATENGIVYDSGLSESLFSHLLAHSIELTPVLVDSQMHVVEKSPNGLLAFCHSTDFDDKSCAQGF